MSKLLNDNIELIIDVNGTKAEQEYHSLSKSTDELIRKQKELRQELKNVVDKKSDEAKFLKKQLDEVSGKIKQNGQRLKELTNEMGVTNLSMNQLRARARDLSKQLDATSKNLHPAEWEALNSKLIETKNQMNELKNASNGLSDFYGRATEVALWGNVFANMIDKATGRLKELAAEGIRMAESADGVQRAFNKLDKPNLLDNLRAATKGTVNDLQLMQAAVKARDFRIPLEDLGKYLAYAQMKAQETGQSVEYLTDSIIMGLGRQSKQILDNLGLSATEISEEVAKAGDFVTGVTAIVDRQLASAGEAYVSAADRSAAATVKLENAQLRLGQALMPVKEAFDEMRAAGASLLSIIIENRKYILSVVAAFNLLVLSHAKLRTYTMATNTATKVFSAVVATSKSVALLAVAAFNKLTGNVNRATAAMRAFTVAWKSNPIGIVTTLLTTAASAFLAFHKSADEATESLTAMDRVNRRMAESDDTSIQRIQYLNKVIHDETAAIELRREALAEIQNLVPAYHANLSAEGKLINDNTEALTAYITALNKEAKAKAMREELDDLYKRQMKLESDIAEGEAKVAADLEKKGISFGNSKRLKKNKEELEAINEDIDNLNKSILLNSSGDGGAEDASPKSLIKELEEQRKALVEARDAATSEKDIAARNREIQLIDEKIQRLQNLGKTTKDTSDTELSATQKLSEARALAIEKEKQLSESQTAVLKKQLDENIISQAEYDVLSARAATASAENRLQIEQELQKQISETTFKNTAEREKAESDAAQHVLEAQTAVNKALLAEEQVFRDNLKAIQQSALLEHDATLAEQREAEMAALDTYYKAALSQAEGNSEALRQVKEAYLLAVERIQQKYNQKEQEQATAAQQENDQLRQQLGLESYRTELDTRLQMLRDALAKGAITEQEYNKQVALAYTETWKTQFDRWQSLASNAFNALQQAEIDTSSAKYDVLIDQARKAGQDTTALEEEKEAKQLEIQKKYADVNFAVKVSQIIADTAVSIMQAYAQLGPIAGSVAAVLMGVVGAAQVATASAERNKIKSLRPGSASSSSGTSAGSARVLTGREKGGYVSVRRRQDGRLYRNVSFDPDRRGYVDRPTVIVGEGAQSKEFVASNAAVNNPTVAPLLDIIDQAQQAGNIRTLDMNKIIRTRLSGFADGGRLNTGTASDTGRRDDRYSPPSFDSLNTLEHLNDTLRSLQRDGIPASVALTEIDRKRELRDRARSIGQKR